ncbi:hypothetical protein MAMP_01585 [Methylophaga aminisulfidivorans MP]|uniref:Uncharacterized protein n=1 Tax=Methylophaga aminisulfidivorans MP TaxID=1026882 RepID=F5SZU9_9GAMM|nr:hypothetical protein MAMP_01585 [Methylophaga aminisulfidivorans MP]
MGSVLALFIFSVKFQSIDFVGLVSYLKKNCEYQSYRRF